jgi:hypothetical protein
MNDSIKQIQVLVPKRKKILLVKMKEKNLLKIQPLQVVPTKRNFITGRNEREETTQK